MFVVSPGRVAHCEASEAKPLLRDQDSYESNRSDGARKRFLAAIILNMAIVIMEIIGLALSASTHGLKLFMYYTENSNIFTLISSAVFVVFAVGSYYRKSFHVPVFARLLRFFSVCCLTLTFLIVLTVLAPMYGQGGYKVMFLHDAMLYTHLLCPLVSLASFLLLEDFRETKFRYTAYALIPTIVYAIISVSLNILRIWDGPYPFLKVHNQPLAESVMWFLVIPSTAYIICCLIWLASRNGTKRRMLRNS